VKPRKVLFLGSNPTGTARLALDREVREIEHQLQLAKYRCFELVTHWTTEAGDLLQQLRRSTPIVVHFSGHGNHAGGRRTRHRGAHRDVELAQPNEGLVLHGRDASIHIVSYDIVKEMFGLAGSSVKLVILNACYTERLASALLAHVDCVVGIAGAIDDQAATEFSKGLYAALGHGATIEEAYRAGCLQIKCAGLPDARRPQLKVRAGIDASQIVLAATPRRRKSRSRRKPKLVIQRRGKPGQPGQGKPSTPRSSPSESWCQSRRRR
jgi:hypothetical protein